MGSLPIHHRGSRGFTLVELLVVAAIILVITAVIFTGQGNFNNSVLLSSTTYDIALSFRDAETYGLGTRAQGGIANAGYGLDFQSGASHSYTFFADSDPPPGNSDACHPLPTNGASAPNAYPGDCVYSQSDGTVSVYQLGNSIGVNKFCASSDNGASWTCSTDASNPLNQLDIVFLRPNATPFISENGDYDALSPPTNACLQIAAPGGASQYINVYQTGQITIASACAGGSTSP